MALIEDAAVNARRRGGIGLLVLTKDRCEMLFEMLRSIRGQSHRDFACIVLDNGSEDATLEEVRRLELEDGRFSCRPWGRRSSQENFQRAIEIGGREFERFAMLHDDDILELDWLARAVEAMDSHPGCSMVALNAATFESGTGKRGRLWYDDSVGKTIFLPERRHLARWMVQYGSLNFPSILYRGDVMKGWRLERPFGMCSDQHFLLQVAGHGGVAIVGDPLYLYRVHGEQDSSAMDEEQVLALQSYVDGQMGWMTHPARMLERNRNLLKLFRHFRAAKRDFSPGTLVRFLWRWKVFLLDPKELMRLKRSLQAYFKESRAVPSKR